MKNNRGNSRLAGERDGVLRITAQMGSVSAERYKEDESIREVYVEEGVQKIGCGAFLNCKNLRKAVLPNSLIEISGDLFDGCENLEEVSLGNQVAHIGAGAFYNCKSLREIRLPNTLKRIELLAFGHCENLRELTIPEGVQAIEDECFAGCTRLQRLSLPASVAKIGPSVIANCGLQLDVQVHPGNLWFRGQGGNLLSKDGPTLLCCSADSGTVVIPDGVVEIGKYVLRHSQVTRVFLPKGVWRIAERAFIYCPQLTEVSLPEGLQYIGAEAFRACAIEKLVVPESVEQIGKDALTGEKMRCLVLLGSKTRMDWACKEENLQKDVMLIADALEINEYPKPFTAEHGLRGVAERWYAGQEVPDAVLGRFRRYLADHYRKYWDEPAIFALAVAMKILPKKSMDEAIRKATKLKDPAVTAALLQYQHENFPRE